MAQGLLEEIEMDEEQSDSTQDSADTSKSTEPSDEEKVKNPLDAQKKQQDAEEKEEDEDEKLDKQAEAEDNTITPLEEVAEHNEEEQEKNVEEQKKQEETPQEETSQEDTSENTTASTTATPVGDTQENDQTTGNTPEQTTPANQANGRQNNGIKTVYKTRRIWDNEEDEQEEQEQDDAAGLTPEQKEEKRVAAERAEEFGRNKFGKGFEATKSTLKTVGDIGMDVGDKAFDLAQTGVSKVYNAVKPALFKATYKVGKAASATKKFFTKSLPGAIKSGAGFLGGLLKKTWLGKKIADKWEAGRPAREQKAAAKAAEKAKQKAEWLKQKDIKRHEKEEKKRLKAEAKAEKKRLEEEEEARNGPSRWKRFKNWVSTGAKKLVKKVAESPVGKFVGNTVTKVKNSTFAAWVGREANDITKYVKKVGKWVKKKKQAISDFATAVSDDYDQYAFEEHVEEMSQKEGNADYWDRYNRCVDELEEKLAPMRGLVKSEEIAEAVKALEKGKDPESALDTTIKTTGKVTEFGGKASDILNKGISLFDKTKGKAFANVSGKVLDSVNAAKDGMKAVNNVIKTVDNVDKARMFEAAREAAENEGDTDLENANYYAASNSKIEAVKNGFGALENLASGATKMAKVTGAKPVADAIKFTGKVVSMAGDAVTSTMKGSETKTGFKRILGGPEGYKAMKAKYGLKARAMRAAICDALGVMYMDDAVNVHKWNMSKSMATRAENGDEQAKLMAERGGAGDTKIKDFAKLMGAGKFAKSRGRRKRREGAPATATA